VLSFPPSVRIYVAREPVDLRRSFDALAALVPTLWASDPLSGHVFCFFNRRADRVKLLVWDRTGFWLFYKRLEAGRFAREAVVSGEWTARELFCVLEGIDLATVRQRRRYCRPKRLAIAG
jgi:transposase